MPEEPVRCIWDGKRFMKISPKDEEEEEVKTPESSCNAKRAGIFVSPISALQKVRQSHRHDLRKALLIAAMENPVRYMESWQ